MRRKTYQISLQPDGSHGVMVRQLGTVIGTAVGFAGEADAHAWIARDQRWESGDEPLPRVIPPYLVLVTSPNSTEVPGVRPKT